MPTLNPIDQDNSPTPNVQPQRTLRRALGPFMAIAVVVGNVIGSGIFYKPGNIAADSGNFGLIIGVWILGGLLCFLGALCLAELATMLPHAGGIYVYLQQAYGRLVAFLFGWTELLFVKPASIGALAVVFVGSLTLSLQWNASMVTQVILSIALILGMAWVNILGVLWGGRLQFATTVLKASFLALVGVSPFLLAPMVGWNIDFDNYSSTTVARHTTLASQIGAVLLAVMWAYNGWDGIAPLAEEIRNPNRNIPLALFGGIGILVVLYVIANIAYHGVLSMHDMRMAGDHAAERMLEKLVGPTGQRVMSLVIMCSVFGAINSNLLLAPRVTFAMGRDGTFFRWLGVVHANYQTPVIAILATSLMAVALVVAVAVAKFAIVGVDPEIIQWELGKRIVVSLHEDSTFELLTNLVIFSASVFYALAVFAVVVLRIRSPNLNRSFRTWGYPLVPLLFLAVYIWFLAQVYGTNPLESRAGVFLILIGIPVYYAYRFYARKNPE